MDYRPLLLKEYIIDSYAFPYHESSEPILKYKLMLKQHYETGVAYLCITKRKDYKEYLGSGSKWKNLIKGIPGKILTTLLYTTDSEDELSLAAAFHSILYGIPNNPNFANLVPELGYEGNQGNLAEWVNMATPEQLAESRTKQIATLKATITLKRERGEKFGIEIANEKLFAETGLTSYMQIPEIATKCREASEQGLLRDYGVNHNMKIPGLAAKAFASQRKTMLATYGFEYMMQIPEFIEKANKSRLTTFREKYGVDNPSQLPDHKEKSGKKISESLLAKPKTKCSFCDIVTSAITNHERMCIANPNRIPMKTETCEYCGIETITGNYVRWHGVNCKQNPNKKEI